MFYYTATDGCRSVRALVASFVAVSAVTITSARAGEPGTTYSRDVAPILRRHCVECHSPGRIAPFSLTTFADVRPRARQIVRATSDRTMPPWLPQAGFAEFSGATTLTEDEIHTIERWAREGARRGDERRDEQPVALPVWRLGQPDLVVTLDDVYSVEPGAEHFRNFVFRSPVSSTKFIRGLEFNPGNAALVHHAVLTTDPLRAARRLDEEDPRPGFDGALWDGVGNVEAQVVGWTPGKSPSLEPPGLSWTLPGGADIVLQLHLVPLDHRESLRPQLALYFAEDAQSAFRTTVRLGSKEIDIPPGVPEYVVADEYTLPVAIDVLSVYPHAHAHAKTIEAFAVQPTGETTWLLRIQRWNYHWQDEYRYARPVRLPAGTTIRMRYVYDTATLRSGALHTARRTGWGPLSSDEMAELWLQVRAGSASGIEHLQQDRRVRERSQNLTFAQQRVARDPGDTSMRNYLALLYLEVGQSQKALEELFEAVNRDPRYVPARINLGGLLLAGGHIAPAIEQLTTASELAPGNYRAHFNLANAWRTAGQVEEATHAYEASIACNPAFADAHNLLGEVLGLQHKFDAARQSFERAIVLDPRHSVAHNNLGWILAAEGRLRQAEDEFQTALSLNPTFVEAQRNLELVRQRRD